MLFSNKLIKNAIQHFPRWMDIRKRYFSSNGGKILLSISEEVEQLQEQINDYIKSFFIPYYEEKINKIPDFIYKANIGVVEKINATLEVIEPNLEITEDIKTFYTNNNYAYYQNGFLFIKEKKEKIIVRIDGMQIETDTEKMHVWNVFDEFALFIGISRYEDENNEELYNRILKTSNSILNSSNDGLVNVIYNSLSNIVPEIEKVDIVLERPTAKNLQKYYDEYNTILDKLAEINRDVLKNKQWDKDLWYTDFKEIDYISNTWDVTLKSYESGIGDNDDLKPIIIDNNLTTNAEIKFYEKSDDELSAYMKNNDIDDSVTLSLYKYTNILNPLTAKYKITATEALEINELQLKPITFELYKSISGQHYRNIEDILSSSNPIKDINITNNGILKNDKYYKVKFIPKDKYDFMEIKDLYYTENGLKVDLKDDSINQMFTSKGDTLYNINSKIKANKLYHFNSYSNVIDSNNGIMIENISDESTLVLEANNCQNEMMKVIYECEETTLTINNISLNNFYYNKDTSEYISDTVKEEKNLNININANSVSFKIMQGDCNIITSIDGNIVNITTPIFDNGSYLYKSPVFDSPHSFDISIIVLGQNITKISNIMFSKYEIDISLLNGKLIKDNNKECFYLPNETNNMISIKIRTFTQFSPILKKIYIGEEIDESLSYISKIIKPINDATLIINSNCKVELYESYEEFEICDKANENLTVTYNYLTNKTYTATSNDSYIVIDISNYNSVNSISLVDGTYEVVSNNTNNFYMIRLKQGQSISGLTIDGNYNEKLKSISLNSIISKKIIDYNPEVNNDKAYVNLLTKDLLIERTDKTQTKIDITFNDFNTYDDKVSLIKIINLPDSLQAAFTINDLSDDEEKIYTVMENEKEGDFDKVYFYPKGAKEYIAYNEHITFLKEKNNIQMVNTFNNGYVDNMFMMYKVESLNDDFLICFNNLNEWSLGKQKLYIKFRAISNNSLYEKNEKKIKIDIKLEDIIQLKDIYINDNKEALELAQYIIEDEKYYNIIYNDDITNESNNIVEYVDVNPNGFNKLKYSNLISIKSISKLLGDGSGEEMPEEEYEVLKNEGIITWLNKDLLKYNEKLLVIYAIKKPIAIKFKSDYLYKKISYPVESYKMIYSFNIFDIEDNQKISMVESSFEDIELNNSIKELYNENTIIYVKCENKSFAVEKSNDILLFKKVYKEDAIAVKSGWYYIYGREYYMFATNDYKDISENDFITFNETVKEDGEIFLHKKTANYVKNSKMKLSSFSNTYKIEDFEKIKDLTGSSSANVLTACNTYNNWNTFNMNMQLEKGLNGLGIRFSTERKEYDTSYAILEITDLLHENNLISLYNPDKVKMYLGKRKNSSDIDFTDTMFINELIEINKEENDFYSISFYKEKDVDYYLIVAGDGLIDDVIIQDKEKYDINLHVKNINLLSLSIEEKTTPGITKRLFIDNKKGNKNNNTEVNHNGYIITSSNIDWNLTKIMNYSTEKDWINNFKLTNVNISKINEKDSIISTEERYGNIITKPVYLGSTKIINKIILKINNIPFKSMEGVTCYLTQSKTANGTYMPCKLRYSNNSMINYSDDIIYEYIQLKIDIPPHKIINNVDIYIEYKSTENSYPIEVIQSSGSFISKILDTYFGATYRLKNIEIEDSSGDFDIYIRAAKEESMSSIWTIWKKVEIENNQIINNITFEDYRYFQIKVELKSSKTEVKINYIDLEVVS